DPAIDCFTAGEKLAAPGEIRCAVRFGSRSVFGLPGLKPRTQTWHSASTRPLDNSRTYVPTPPLTSGVYSIERIMTFSGLGLPADFSFGVFKDAPFWKCRRVMTVNRATYDPGALSADEDYRHCP